MIRFKAGKDCDTDRFYSVVGELEGNGADAMDLGCTELSVINRSLEHDPRLVDSTEALAYYAIGLCGKTPTRLSVRVFGFGSPNTKNAARDAGELPRKEFSNEAVRYNKKCAAYALRRRRMRNIGDRA